MKKLLVTAAVLFLSGTAAQAVVLYNDTFNGNAPGSNVTPAGWTVSSGTVDVVTAYPSGTQLVLDGGSLVSNAVFNFAAGSTYKVTFDYGKTVDSLEVLTFGIGTYGNGIMSFGAALPGLITTSYSFLVMTSFSSGISFGGFSGFSNNMLIDNVTLEDVTPIPLPPAVLFLGTGLMGIGALKRRRGV